MCKRKPPFLNKKNLTLSIVSSLLKISVVSPVTRMTHQKKKWNGTCIWSALLLTLSTAAPSTATTLTGLGSDRASAIIRFWALVSADVIEKLLCFAILFSRPDFLSFPFKSCFSSSSYSPSSLTCPSCVDFFCHDMIRHETILFRSYPFFSFKESPIYNDLVTLIFECERSPATFLSLSLSSSLSSHYFFTDRHKVRNWKMQHRVWQYRDTNMNTMVYTLNTVIVYWTIWQTGPSRN